MPAKVINGTYYWPEFADAREYSLMLQDHIKFKIDHGGEGWFIQLSDGSRLGTPRPKTRKKGGGR